MIIAHNRELSNDLAIHPNLVKLRLASLAGATKVAKGGDVGQDEDGADDDEEVARPVKGKPKAKGQAAKMKATDKAKAKAASVVAPTPKDRPPSNLQLCIN